ncbi:MAG: hypothetical protein EXS38_12215 [Opitutus sp.]|nr:hypothetical protein [Opitutus sp.]
MTTSFPCFLAAASLAFVGSAGAGEAAILAKARAYIGSEAALDGLKTLHYTGTVVTTDPADPTKQTRSAMEMIFQKSDQQRIMATSDKLIEITALDGYDGWQRLQDPADATKWRQSLLGSEQIKRLRAQAWENLAYYRGIDRVGGRIEDQGTASMDGVACQKIAFIHGPGIVFIRYFELATGRLVFTELEGGGTVKEVGELRSGGIRFPKTVIQTSKNAAGQVFTLTLTFEKVVVNEALAPKLFAVPGLSNR